MIAAGERARAAASRALIALVASLLLLGALLAQPAAATNGGQIGEGFGTPGTGNGQFYNPASFGADPVDGTLYSVDYTGLIENESTEFRIQQLSSAGAFKASATVPRYPVTGKPVALIGIAVDHDLGRIYLVETCRVAVVGGSLACKEASSKVGAVRILVYSTTPSGSALQALTPIALPSGANQIYDPRAIAVDPSTHDIVLLAQDNSAKKIVQRISSGGTLGARYTDTAEKLKPTFNGFANSLAVGPTGIAYTITGEVVPGSEKTRAWQLPADLSTLTEVPGFAATAEKEAWPLGLVTRSEPGLGGPQLAISSDGSTLYWKEWRKISEEKIAGDMNIRAYSLSEGKTKAIWGGGSSRCKITTSTAALAATTGGNLAVFDFGAPTTTVGSTPAFGLKVLTFGAGGTGCVEPVAKFTINGKAVGEEVVANPGESVTFSAASSELAGGFRKELIWKFGDGQEKVVTGATEETEAATGVTHTYTNAGNYTVKLEIKLLKPPYGDPAPVERSFNVGAGTPQFELKVLKAGSGSGKVTSTPAGVDCGSICSPKFDQGTEVELLKAPDAGSKFVKWTGACTGSGTCKVTMSAAKEVTAEFATIPSFLLKVKKQGSGTGTVTSNTGGINCGSGAGCEASFQEATAVTLSSVSGANTKAVAWSGCDEVVSGECKVTMSAAKEVTATYALEQHQLGVTKTGTGTGTVTSVPAGISCGSTCSADFDHSQVVTLSGAPGANTQAVKWTGCDEVVSGECKVTVSGAKAVTAEFALVQRELSITRGGSGAGTVTSAPTGIDCGLTCKASFNHAVEVTLSQSASGGSEFKGWSGACTGSGTCKVTMTEAKAVTANFDLIPGQKLLKVKKQGTGTGTVTSAPTGINCGSTCEASFTENTVITLSSTPGPNTEPVVWSGCDEVVSGQCKVTLSASKEVTATYALEQHQLTVTKTGNGTGAVTSAPGGINCGATCSADFDHNAVVTLTGTPASGSQAVKWTGCGEVVAGACKVTVSGAKAVTAEFVLQQFQLSAAKNGTGSGTVTSAPGGIDCGSSCSASFNSGVQVTLTAAPASGSSFTGWGGACSGTGTCQVTVDAARSVTATFTADAVVPPPPPPPPPPPVEQPKKPTNAEKLQKALKKCKKLKGKAKTRCVKAAKKKYKPRSKSSSVLSHLEHQSIWWGS